MKAICVLTNNSNNKIKGYTEFDIIEKNNENI